MVTVACVKKGTKYGPQYVERLANGVLRWMPRGLEYRFVCFTDDPMADVDCEPLTEDLPGWWSKLELFKAERPLIYFDLDTIIVGDLTPLIEWEGFGILKDPWLPGYGSGVMKLTGGEGHVWRKFRPGIMGMLRGDQDWLNLVMPDARTFPPSWFPAFKAHDCFGAPPDGAIAVSFHGFPKVHQVSAGWVPQYWR